MVGDAQRDSVPEADLLEALRLALGPLLAGRNIALAYLHGSAAHGRATHFSDVDIALVSDETLSPLAQLDLELDLETQLLASGIGDPDVRVVNRAPLSAQLKIVTGGIVVYARDEDSAIRYVSSLRSVEKAAPIASNNDVAEYLRAARFELKARGMYAG